MEFNEKLQQLRKQKGLTQEQLAEQLFVSRAAISKWESGKGYPNIDSLKAISEFFSVSIDDLLSGDELITIAETENSTNIRKIYSFLLGIVDILAIILILMPVYGNQIDGYIYSVNLLEFTDTTTVNLNIYWGAFIIMIALGFLKIILTYIDRDKEGRIVTKLSLAISVLAICFLAATREPYATTILFLLFIAKIFLFIKNRDKIK